MLNNVRIILIVFTLKTTLTFVPLNGGLNCDFKVRGLEKDNLIVLKTLSFLI